MGAFTSYGNFNFVVLVILTILAFAELSDCCHRRVEYHHFYKKPPHKGHGHHGGGHGHGGYSKGHGHGHGHSKGYGHGHGGHGHGGHGKGHGGYGGGGHGGYGHEMKGYGGGGHGGHGGGYGHEMKGHGHGGGYGHEMKGYGGGGYGHDDGGHGHGYGKGHGHGGHDHGGHGGGYGHGKGYGGHDDHGGGYGHGHGKGHGGHGKGKKYKYQMYETSHYDDKGGYSHASPHYMHKGYGYSGPYPNTEYSSPVEASVDPPTEITGSNPNSFDVGLKQQLDAADTADLIRNTYEPKENEVMSPYYSGSGGDMSDSSSNMNHHETGMAMPTPTMEFPPGNSQAGSQDPTVDPASGNFDLNLNFNSDVPAPFRRNFDGSKGESGAIVQRKRKKISSKYKGRTNQSGDTDSSQTEQLPATSFFQENYQQAGEVKSDKPPEFVEFMNF